MSYRTACLLGLLSIALASCGRTPLASGGESESDAGSSTSSAESASTAATSASSATTAGASAGSSGSSGGVTSEGVSVTAASSSAGATTTSGSATSSTSTSASSSSSTSTTGASSTGGSTTGALECEPLADCKPLYFIDEALQLTDIESGWEVCGAWGDHYRVEAIECAHKVFWPVCQGEGGSCETDNDCESDSQCLNVYGTCGCRPKNCMSDSDCPDGEVCVCAAQGDGYAGWTNIKNTCEPASCASAADCPEACGCHGSEFFCGTVERLHCPTLTDECATHEDCDGEGGRCYYEPDESRWVCGEWGFCE
ncbi:MAG: hypothetical protein H6713_23660 [Myxococcales bacterium]|nr:hypothetical protein [Myxococcales bacterium]